MVDVSSSVAVHRGLKRRKYFMEVNPMMDLFKFLFLVALIVPVLFFSTPTSYAKPHGQGGGAPASMPAGFGHGEKKGWGDSKVPPGWERGNMIKYNHRSFNTFMR